MYVTAGADAPAWIVVRLEFPAFVSTMEPVDEPAAPTVSEGTVAEAVKLRPAATSAPVLLLDAEELTMAGKYVPLV